MNTASETIRIATFVTCIGLGALRPYKALPFASDENKKMDVVVALFQQQCIGETNVINEPFVFNRGSQEKSEDFDCYLTALKEIARRCEFREMTEQLLRDRVVCWIGDNALRKRLLQQNNLTLQDCVDMCNASEDTTRQLQVMSADEGIHVVRTHRIVRKHQYCQSKTWWEVPHSKELNQTSVERHK